MLVVYYTVGYTVLLLIAGLISDDKSIGGNVLFNLTTLVPVFGRVFGWW